MIRVLLVGVGVGALALVPTLPAQRLVLGLIAAAAGAVVLLLGGPGQYGADTDPVETGPYGLADELEPGTLEPGRQ